MTGPDDEFDDFLKRRKPVFRSPDDMFEPPAELDRVVLRQAREAIESERPVRVFRDPRWAAPMALAATLVFAFTVLFYAGLPQKQAPEPEVTVQNIAERVDCRRRKRRWRPHLRSRLTTSVAWMRDPAMRWWWI